MDRGYFMGCCLIGMGAALAVFIPLKAKRIACIPRLVWWLCLILGAIACIYGLSHSTAPSFATRITAVGRAYDDVERHQGRDTYFVFRFVPDGGQPVNIETEIILPGWANPAIFNGRTFRVVYLDNNKRALKNEAIDIEILSGRDTGFHDSLDARPVGKWLGIPFGAALGTFGLFGIKYKKDDDASAASDDDTSSHRSDRA
jgi:hypothetical protein